MRDLIREELEEVNSASTSRAVEEVLNKGLGQILKGRHARGFKRRDDLIVKAQDWFESFPKRRQPQGNSGDLRKKNKLKSSNQEKAVSTA